MLGPRDKKLGGSGKPSSKFRGDPTTCQSEGTPTPEPVVRVAGGTDTSRSSGSIIESIGPQQEAQKAFEVVERLRELRLVKRGSSIEGGRGGGNGGEGGFGIVLVSRGAVAVVEVGSGAEVELWPFESC